MPVIQYEAIPRFNRFLRTILLSSGIKTSSNPTPGIAAIAFVLHRRCGTNLGSHPAPARYWLHSTILPFHPFVVPNRLEVSRRILLQQPLQILLKSLVRHNLFDRIELVPKFVMAPRRMDEAPTGPAGRNGFLARPCISGQCDENGFSHESYKIRINS